MQQKGINQETSQLENYTLTRLIVRGLKICAVVGTALLTINHGEAIKAGNWPEIWRIFLNYLVPFLVSTLSSHALLQQIKPANK